VTLQYIGSLTNSTCLQLMHSIFNLVQLTYEKLANKQSSSIETFSVPVRDSQESGLDNFDRQAGPLHLQGNETLQSSLT
jgi:hypothetical protein